MNKYQARDNLLKSVRLVVDGLEYIGIPPLKARDKREPGRKEKMEFEDEFSALMLRHFIKQRKMLKNKLEFYSPQRKALPIDTEDLFSDDGFLAEVMTFFQKAVRNGVRPVREVEQVAGGLDIDE